MEVTQYELLQGKATIIKGKEYLSAKDYVQPFIDTMTSMTDNFVIQVKLADQISVGDDKNVVYNRVHIQAILPEEHDCVGFAETYGLVYGLDLRKPVAKVYRGYTSRETGNLMMCNLEWVKYQELKPTEPIDLTVGDLMEKTNDFKIKLERMKRSFLADEDKHRDLGNWIDFSLDEFHFNGIHSTKLSTPDVIKAYEAIYKDGESDFYCDESQVSSVFNAFEAFAATIAKDKKDIMNTFEKTILLEKMLSKRNASIKGEDVKDLNEILTEL